MGAAVGFKLNSMDHVFPAPVIRFEIAEAAALNRDLKKEIAARRNVEPGIVRSNVEGWHSDRDFFLRQEPAHRTLALDLLRIMAEATRTFDPDADYSAVRLIPDGWVNINPPGAMNAPHNHRGWFWSGCYYVDVDEAAGGIEFLNPNEPLPGDAFLSGPLVADRAKFNPKPGQVLLFPATMDHWVYPNRSDRDRISIAFNGKFERKA